MIKSTRLFFEQGHWKKWITPVILICTLFTCIQQINIPNYNNIDIFRNSTYHLLAHQPLYILYPAAYFDYFLYNPSFTVLFMPFAFLSSAAALYAWTFFSVLLFLRAVHLLPGITDTSKKILLLLVLPELLNNQQYVQTNVFLTALMLLAFIYFEKGKPSWAAFFAVLAFCIKGYGGIVGLLFLFYPGKIKFFGYAFVWGVLITALPLLFVSFSETVTYYTDWLKMISSDEIKEGMSLMGMLGKTHTAELITLASGVGLLVLSLVTTMYRTRIRYDVYSRGIIFCYLLVWVVLFNRAAETPTYFIAMTGVALWFVLDGPRKENLFLVGALFVFVYLLPSDLFPPLIHRFFRKQQLKAYPYILFFFYLQFRLWFRPNQHASLHAAA